MCLGALGSQTGGSITRPASYCGIPGLKPTYGRVSADGVMPLAHSMDHPGPMALCVHDLAILLQAIAGPDPRDASCVNRPVPDYTAISQCPGPPTRRAWAMLRGLFEERAELPLRALMEETTERFRQRGAEVARVALPAAFAEVVPRHRIVMAVEAAAVPRASTCESIPRITTRIFAACWKKVWRARRRNTPAARSINAN